MSYSGSHNDDLNGKAPAGAILEDQIPSCQPQRPGSPDRAGSLVSALRGMGYELHSPEGAFWLLPRSPWEDDWAFWHLLMEHNIFGAPGTILEFPGFFRLSLSANDDMIEDGSRP